MRGPILLAALLALAGCGNTSDRSLFPLQAGHELVYRETVVSGAGRVERERRVANLGERVVDGVPLSGRRYDDGTEYWFRVSDRGIERMAHKGMADPAPRPDPPGRFVLKAPVRVGESWQSSTVPYLLMRRHEFPRELRHRGPITMTYTIEAVDDTVDVPAGTFRDCVRVRGIAEIPMNADPVRGPESVPVVTTEWYAPGVGLVRLERVEELPSPRFVTGGRATWVLMERP